MIYINKKLRVENINLENIAKKYGTPAYCYSYNQLKDNISSFKRNFASFSPIICFAVKSNTNLRLLKEIKKFVLKAETLLAKFYLIIQNMIQLFILSAIQILQVKEDGKI